MVVVIISNALLTFASNFIGQIFHTIKKKISLVKISPLEPTGEIGEILPLAKISRYTVNTTKSSTQLKPLAILMAIT